jgi:hypothetical protein
MELKDQPFHVLVHSDMVEERSGVGREDGKPWATRKQPIHVYYGDVYPIRQMLFLEPGQPGYPAGAYLPSGDSFKLGDKGKLTLGTIRSLVPLAALVAFVKDNAPGQTISARATPAAPSFGQAPQPQQPAKAA